MDSSTEVDYNGYLEWAQESLGVLLHFPLRMSPTAGKGERGVFCEDDIPAETIVVSVPWEALLTIDNAKGTPFEGLAEAGAREDDVLCLLLLYHKHVLGESSPFKNHLDALPQEYHQTIFYSDEELELLRGTSLHTVTVQWKSQVTTDFRELEHMVLPSEGSSTARDILGDCFTKEKYMWALGTVWSRFVTVEREGRALKAMAPVFDMFNHDPASSTVHGYQETNHCLHLVTLQDWQAGSEVRLSYGTLPNSRLLLLHGFCLPDNAFDAVELWATMEERAPYYDTKTKILVENGVDCTKRPFILSDRGLDPLLLPALRVQRATERELKTAADGPWGSSLGRRNEAEVCDVLCGALAGMLKDREGPCSTQASSNGPMREPQVASAAALEGRDAGEDQEEEVTRVVLPEDRKKAVELLRMGEERVLRKCLEWVEVRCKALSHLFLSGRCSLNDDPILVPDPSYFAR
ncbi:unnamed protein product [Ascophyllum nodosum]